MAFPLREVSGVSAIAALVRLELRAVKKFRR